MSEAVSSHGIVLERQATPGGVFTTIGEVKDVTLPELSRNEFDVTPHDDDIDAYVMGVLRRSLLQFQINYKAGDAEHDEVTGLYKHLIDNTETGYRATCPDGDVLIFSGFVKAIGRPVPVDGALVGDVSIRPSGRMLFNEVVVGA